MIEKCPITIDLNQLCGRPATRTVIEPHTPKGFKVRCCEGCEKELLRVGYLKRRG